MRSSNEMTRFAFTAY